MKPNKQLASLLSNARQVSIRSFSSNLCMVRGDLNKSKGSLPQENRDSVEKSNAKGGATSSSKETSTGSSVSSSDDSGAFTDQMKTEYKKMMNKPSDEKAENNDDKQADSSSPFKDDLQTQPAQNDTDQTSHRTINDVRNEQHEEQSK